MVELYKGKKINPLFVFIIVTALYYGFKYLFLKTGWDKWWASGISFLIVIVWVLLDYYVIKLMAWRTFGKPKEAKDVDNIPE